MGKSLKSILEKLPQVDRLLVGVRPEKIVCIQDASYHFNLIKFKTKVDFEENLGANKNVYFKLGKSDFCASIPSTAETNDILDLSINPRDLYFFDYISKEPFNKREEII